MTRIFSVLVWLGMLVASLPQLARADGFSAEPTTGQSSSESGAAAANYDRTGSSTGLNGTWIEAVERNVNPSPNVIGLNGGIYPFDPYFYSVEAALDFTHHFSETFAWEVFNASYEFGIAKDLTNLLGSAQYGVDTTSLERLNYIVSTDALFVIAYGKSLFGSDSVKYFRLSLVGGGGIVGTSLKISPAVDSGLRLEIYLGRGRRASLRFDFRDMITVASSSSIYPRFLLGLGFGL